MISTKILEILNSAIGKEIPNLHKIPMFTQKFNGKMISAKRGEVIVEFEVVPDMTNPLGLLHGGMQCTLMDDIIGLASATLGHNGFSISINLQITYLSTVKIGEKIHIQANIIREGRNIINATSKIYKTSGKLIATGKSDLL